MRHLLSTAVLLALGTAPAAAGAQITERPVPFDSAERVTVITPPLAARLRLAPPAWPVTGDFREARLYESGDAYVLVVERRGRSLERYPITAQAREELRVAISTGMAQAGNPVGEGDDEVISESAKGAFMRNQMLASALIYAPALAALTNDATAGTATYLLATGGAFFAAASLARSLSVSRAQNHLATDGALRGAVMTSALYYGLTGARESDPYEATVLAGSLGGAIAGFHLGRGLTDGEAQGMTMGSSVAALTALGLMGTAGMFREECRTIEEPPFEDCEEGFERPDYLVLVGAGALGFPLGLRYVRRARYTVTAGDLNTLYTVGALGVLAALTPIIDTDVSEEMAWGVATAGLLGGVIAGDRFLIKPYDHTKGEAWLLAVGALAGGLIGAVPPVLMGDDVNATVALGSITAGAILGTVATERLIEPRRGTLRVGSGPTGGAPGGAADRPTPRLHQFSPVGAALAAAGAPGRHGLLHVSF